MKTLLVIGIVAIVLWIVYGAYRIAVFCENLKWLRREKRAEEWAEKNADLLNSGMIYGRSSASKFNPAFVIYYSAFNLCKRLSKHLDELREKLTPVYDVERLLSKIAYESVNPHDCLALTKSLKGIRFSRKNTS